MKSTLSSNVFLGPALRHSATGAPAGDRTRLDGETFLVIRNVDAMPPFFMNVVSADDLWLFVGSNGPFTAGRTHPDHAIFPYQNVDRILRHADESGARTIFRVRRADGGWSLWEPGMPGGCAYRMERNLYKHELGCEVMFEEINHDLQLSFRARLTAAGPYGLVRQCSLAAIGAGPADVRFLDGWSHLITPGVSVNHFARYSYLVPAYMRHDQVPGTGMGIFTLNAGISDRPEPSESLRATAAWSVGHREPAVLLSEKQVEAFRAGEAVQPEIEVRGEYGAYLAAGECRVTADRPSEWILGVDTQLDHAALLRLQADLQQPGFADRVRAAVQTNRDELRRRVAAADGLQAVGDPPAATRHLASVLYNCMRGGTFENSYAFPSRDVAAYLRGRNREVLARHEADIAAWPGDMTLERLWAWKARLKDRDLDRLLAEYLPLTFSRRHGDPSRPWNWFSIRLRDENGEPAFHYEGNWRDIFQNWESLARSFPGWLPAMVRVFLNASTADGYNPYRITRKGIDWEAEDPHDPWSHIGYWGDHQIIYLLRLLEGLEDFRPGELAKQLSAKSFVYACVPYEIAEFDRLVENPRKTITFNHALHRELIAAEQRIGGDARLLKGPDGRPATVCLAEKLLVPLLAKLSNFVPGGGIWLNTQRPEWNDANNALAGWGLSVVTVGYLRRYLAFLERVLAAAAADTVPLSASVATMLRDMARALHETGSDSIRDARQRFAALERFGRIGEQHRRTVYQRAEEPATAVPVAELRGLIAAALAAVDATLQANRRGDGLFHGYNVLHIKGREATVESLAPMLEGQVAILSSGFLDAGESLALLRALRASALYTEDRRSYLLYPDQQLAPFLDRNNLPADAAVRAPVLGQWAAAGERSVVVADSKGGLHFQADLHNAGVLGDRLDRLSADPAWAESVRRDRDVILSIWEELFRHSRFTGRSTTFFAFEGLGSIYWHMVSKLQLAVQEVYFAAGDGQADPKVLKELADCYYDIRAGLGFNKTPAEYGAFPTDPYSCTPRGKGAQQPGMTGQVKEDVLTRLGELGVRIRDGVLHFEPVLLRHGEWLEQPAEFRYRDLQGSEQIMRLAVGTLAFTYCQVPVVVVRSDRRRIEVRFQCGETKAMEGASCGLDISRHIFDRDGQVAGLTVYTESGRD